MDYSLLDKLCYIKLGKTESHETISYPLLKLCLSVIEHAFVENRPHEIIGMIKVVERFAREQKTAREETKKRFIKSDDSNNEKVFKGLPIYHSLLYGAEIYEFNTTQPYFYCKRELEVIIFAIKTMLSQYAGQEKLAPKVNLKLNYKYLCLLGEVSKEIIDCEAPLDLSKLREDLDFSNELKYTYSQKDLGFRKEVLHGLANHLAQMNKVLGACYKFREGDHQACFEILKQDSTCHNDAQIDLYAFNILGCSHALIGKPNLATFYLRKALMEARELKVELEGNVQRHRARVATNAVSRAPQIVFNLALSSFIAGDYEKSIKHFSQIQSIYTTSFMFWYRFGSAYFKYCMRMTEELESKKNNDLYEEKCRSMTSETAKSKADSLNRFYLRTSEVPQKRAYSNIREHMKKAVDCFYNAYVLVNKTLPTAHVKQVQKDLNTFVTTPLLEREDPLKKLFGKVSNSHLNKMEKEHQDLIISMMSHISYLQLSLGRPKQALIMINTALEMGDNLPVEHKFKFLSYHSQALADLGDGKSAIKILLDLNTSDRKLACSSQIDGFSYESDRLYSEKSIATANIASLSLLFGESPKLMSSRINSALQAIEGFENKKVEVDLPTNLHHANIYFYLLANNTQMALQHLRRRRIVVSSPQKPLLNISK